MTDASGRARRVLPDTDLYALTDAGLCLGRDTVEVARALFEAGVRILQYREKDKPGRVRLAEARAIARLAREAGACFLVNDYVDLALLSDADGVHLGQDDVPPGEARRLLGEGRIVGVSTHSPEQALRAVADGADYIGVGPVYATATKRDVCEPVGLDYVSYAAANVKIPWVAIGGIKRGNVGEVVGRGARMVAMVSELVGAEDIAERVAEVRAAMRRDG